MTTSLQNGGKLAPWRNDSPSADGPRRVAASSPSSRPVRARARRSSSASLCRAGGGRTSGITCRGGKRPFESAAANGVVFATRRGVRLRLRGVAVVVEGGAPAIAQLDDVLLAVLAGGQVDRGGLDR